MKKDSAADVNLAGAVFGIYSDSDCKNLIITMPETDSNGKSSATIVKTQDTVYLKEITAPKGYVVNTTAYNVKLVASKTTTTTVPDKEQLGELTVYKEGMALYSSMKTDVRKVLFITYTQEKILSLPMVRRFTAKAIW